MFIVWRKRPILTDRPAELFVAYDYDSVYQFQGRVVRLRRHKATGQSLDETWNPLVCRHRGPGRVAWTPLLMHAERADGKPRQRLLHRFAAIRSCCIQDPFLRAAWWCDVVLEIDYQEREGDPLVSRLIARDRKAILAKLREVVPSPSRRGIDEFTTYRLQQEEVRRKAEEAFRAALRRAEEQRREEAQREREEARRREEEARREREEARRREEEARRWEEEARRAWEEARQEQERREGRSHAAPWWAVLELESPAATAQQVRAQYRKLVKQHHPDRGGDAEVCKSLNAAFEEARWAFGGRL